MADFKENLKKLMPKLEDKIDYNVKKLEGKKTYMSDQIRIAAKEKSYPKIIGTFKIFLNGIDITVLRLLTEFSVVRGPKMINIPLVKDSRNHLITISRNLIQQIVLDEIGDRIRVKKEIIQTVKFSSYYLEKFCEKNQDLVERYGSVEAAVLCDSYDMLFNESKTLNDSCSTEDREKIIKVLSDLSDKNDDANLILKHIDFDNSLSIMKTNSGFSVYKISDQDKIMITYLHHSLVDKAFKMLI